MDEKDTTAEFRLEPRVTRLETGMSGLMEQVSSLGKDIDKIIQSNQKDHEETRQEIRDLARAVSGHGRPNWGIIFAGMSIAITLASGLLFHTYVTIGPVEEKLDTLDTQFTERIGELKDDYYQFGKNTEVMATNRALSTLNSEKVFDLIKNCSETRARLDMLEDKVRDVDSYGSRKWIDSNQEKQ
jgi:hypothetical protein